MIMLGGAVSVVATIMALNVVGVLMASYPRNDDGPRARGPGADAVGARGVLTQPALRICSGLCVTVFLPCLVGSSLAKGVTADKLLAAWAMPLCCWCQIAVALAIGYAVRAWVQPPKHLWRPFLCAVTFQNSSALPLVIVQSLSEQPPFDADPKAFEKIAIYVFVYNIGWQCCFWLFGYPFLAATPGDPNHAKVCGGALAGLSNGTVPKGLKSPVLLSSLVGMAIGPLRSSGPCSTRRPLCASSGRPRKSWARPPCRW